MAKIIDAEVKGLIEAQRKQEQVIRDLRGAPMLNAMRDATLIVERAAKKNAPVDTGRLRASLMPEVRMEKESIVGVVGSNVTYAPYMEFGTRPHWPPIAALETWARRHGRSAYYVAKLISERGLAPRKFLQNAFESNRERIIRRLESGIHKIVEKK